jgi:hypothetical protein
MDTDEKEFGPFTQQVIGPNGGFGPHLCESACIRG